MDKSQTRPAEDRARVLPIPGATRLPWQYYQYIENQKLKGDLKSYFISDYVLWLTKEVNGVQRMDKELRAIFWRFVPTITSL